MRAILPANYKAAAIKKCLVRVDVPDAVWELDSGEISFAEVIKPSKLR